LIGQVRRDGEPYPADPHWHDGAFNNDLPSTEEASGMKEGYQKEKHCRDKKKDSLGHFNLAEKDSSGHLFAEGCDRLIVVLVHPEYCVQICSSKKILDALTGRDQLEFATAVSHRDQKSN